MKVIPQIFKPENDRVVVIGTSVGGMSASIKLLQQLPTDFPAHILMVQHMSGDASGDALLKALNDRIKLKWIHATQELIRFSGQLQ